MLRSNSRTVLATLVLMWVQGRAVSEEWPAFQHDVRRSGYSAEQLDASQLQLDWSWHSPAPPQPAWAGPAKWDAYAGHRDLPPMRSYDLCFQPIVSAGSVFFGSSADDTLYCVNDADGSLRWSYVTAGPIRSAPLYADGRLFFGSDDGFAYCLDAVDGSLVWKYRPVEQERLILNNGRFIPLHPCRTGVLVDQGRAYFGCALLPWKDAYLCSVDAETGQPVGEGCYVQQLSGATLEGPPAATSELLVFPQGRVAPRVFQRADGQDQGALKESSGGSIVVVSLDAGLFHGPGADSRKGGIRRSDLKTREVIASHGRGNALVVSGGVSYMLTDHSLIASDLVKRTNRWSIRCEQPYALIGVGDTLFAGGRDEVVAYRAADGARLWRGSVAGKAYGLAASKGRLLVSTDAGVVHSFVAGGLAKQSTAEVVGSAASSFQPTAVKNLSDKNLRGRWVFQRPHVTENKVRDLAGKMDGSIDGLVQLERAGQLQALSLDGRSQGVLLTADHQQAALPDTEITVEAWLRIDEPREWGGIIGAVQDNGSYERGWVLGYRNARFSFALAGNDGSGSLTYLTAKSDFETGRWYHVAGSYDGGRMRLFINGRLESESTEQKGKINYPPRAFFEIGAYHDQDEYFRLRGQIHEVRMYDRALDAEAMKSHAAVKAELLPSPTAGQNVLELAAGPWLQFRSADSAVVHWRTKDPAPTVLEYWLAEDRKQIAHTALNTEHHVVLTGLRKNRVYRYVIREKIAARESTTREFECDTFFNFTLPEAGAAASSSFGESVSSILRESEIDRGLCLVLGSRRGELALELARQSRFRVIAVETDAERVRLSRETLQAAGVYGSRVTVRHVQDLAELPFVGHFANLVVSEIPLATDQPPQLVAEVLRVLRPDGGLAWLGPVPDSPDTFGQWSHEGYQRHVYRGGGGAQLVVRREALPGAGDWSHLYGRADNSAFGGEQLAGVEKSDDLAVQWIGRPGPRFKPDRNGRKPSPLSTAGRLFVQGLRRLAALDAYNGTVLWSLEIPDLQRFNMPRDCSNWCADRDFVYAAVRDKCWQIDAARGQVVKIHDVVPGAHGGEFDWGALMSLDYQVIGTAVKKGTSWTTFWGGANAGWYDARSGAVTDKVCSDNLFSINKNTGQTDWQYSQGVVINSTLTVTDQRVYFVECRNQDVIDAPERRIGNPKLWEDQYLVALDAYTGKLVWEQPLDTEDGKVVFYLAGGTEDRLTIVASADEKYHVYGFSTANGDQVWHRTFRWPGGKGDHGKAMSRPAIVGDRVYVRPHAFRLADGKQLPQQMPGGGCGTYACSSRALFFRAGTVTMWNQETGNSTGWSRLRPDCWLSAIPAAGMLLSAEGGGGCSCGTWMETSVGFMPVAHR